MRGQQKGKFQIKEPPNFLNFYKRMEQQKIRQAARKAQQNYSNTNLNNRSQFNSMNTPIGLQRYQKSSSLKSNVSSSSRVSNSKTSFSSLSQTSFQPSKQMTEQYAKYETNTKNVFYQDRQQAKLINIYQQIKPLLNLILLFLFVIWAILFSINGYKGYCPEKAEYCGVYIHCKKGYVLENNNCVLSDQARTKVSQICISLIENLQYQYGNYQFQQQTENSRPNKAFDEIQQQYNLYGNGAIMQEVRDWLDKYENQKRFDFRFRDGLVYPNNKKYSLVNKFRKNVNQPFFIIYFIIGVVLTLLCMIFLRLNSQKNRAVRIFNYLKSKTMKQNDIAINIGQIQQNFGRVYRSLWQRVQHLRIEDKNIVVYEDQNLHWKVL